MKRASLLFLLIPCALTALPPDFFPDQIVGTLEVLPSQHKSRGTFYRSGEDFILCRGGDFQSPPPEDPVFLDGMSAGVYNNSILDSLLNADSGRRIAPEEALEKFKTAYEKDPQFFSFAYNYGRLLYIAGSHDEAAEIFRRASAMLEEFSGSYLHRGLSLLYTQERHSARFFFQKAYRLNPDDRRSLYALVRYYTEERSLPKARYYLKELFSRDRKDPQTLLLAAEIELQMKNIPKAQKYFEAAEETTDLFEPNGSDPSVFFRRAVFREKIGERKKALEDYKKVLEKKEILFLYSIDPDNLEKKILALEKRTSQP